MKSRYYLDYYYCGTAIMNELEVGRYYREMTIDGKVKILKYEGKKVGGGHAYALLEYVLYEQPYFKSYEGVKLADEE